MLKKYHAITEKVLNFCFDLAKMMYYANVQCTVQYCTCPILSSNGNQ
jgi:hypothetical protein